MQTFTFYAPSGLRAYSMPYDYPLFNYLLPASYKQQWYNLVGDRKHRLFLEGREEGGGRKRELLSRHPTHTLSTHAIRFVLMPPHVHTQDPLHQLYSAQCSHTPTIAFERKRGETLVKSCDPSRDYSRSRE
eukprot:2867059-Rhodomonas_salina.2